MKLFNSNDVQPTEFCRLLFNFKFPSEQLAYRCKKFASSEIVSRDLVKFSCVWHLCIVITLRAKLSGAVYCYRSCLCVCLCVCLWVCYHDNSKLRE